VAPDDVVEVKANQNPPPTPSLDTPSQKASDVQSEMRVKELETKVETKKEKPKMVSDIAGDITDKIYGIIGHTKHPFSSLLVNPHVFDFEERDSEEKIILVARPHWFTNVSWILTALFLIFVPSLLKFVPIVSDIPVKFQMLGIFTWYLITFAFSFEKFLSWYFDVYIITDERVIDIEFNNLLNKKFSEAKLSMIQDITSRVTGVAQTMFNYGTVYIQTAAEVPEISFDMVPNPEKIIKVLQVLREEEERETLEGRTR
jgi:hypothetical protein